MSGIVFKPRKKLPNRIPRPQLRNARQQSTHLNKQANHPIFTGGIYQWKQIKRGEQSHQTPTVIYNGSPKTVLGDVTRHICKGNIAVITFCFYQKSNNQQLEITRKRP